MADTARTVDIFMTLPFKDYDDDWVKSAWERDFTDIDPLTLDLENDLTENEYHTEGLRKVCHVLDEWIQKKEGPQGEGFWTVLVENNLSFKSFTALLAYLMEVGHRKVANGQQREAGLLGVSCYFKLVTIPGSGAFKLFHPMLFQRGMDMLKSSTTLGGGGGKRKKQSSLSNTQVGRGRGKRARQNITVESEIEEFSDEEEGEEALTGPEMNRIRRAILALLKDFIQLLDNFSLNQSESSGHYAITVLSELTKQDPELFVGRFDRLDESSSSMCALAYLGLMKLLSPTHGDVSALTTSVFKHLLPSILMLIGENKRMAASTIPKPILVNKNHAVEFVCFLMNNCERSVLPVVRILIQHMCAKVPDKAEYRTKVAQSIIRILNELPVEQFATIMEWIAKFSKNGKNSYRAFSLDLIGLLVLEPQKQFTEAIPEEKREFLEQKFLIEIIISRCSDLGPTVRARAITAFANCLSSGNASVLEAVKALVTPRPPSNTAPGVPPRLIPTPDIERTQKCTENTNVLSEDNRPKDTTTVDPPPVTTDTPGVTADTPMGAKRDTPVPVYLETPTMNICLQDNKGVISMLCRRASDEKVMVRKAAIQALEKVIRLEGASYRLQDVEVLKDRTRDPALSVRRQAMQSLTDLLHNRPEDKQLQCAWLDGVLPLVMDRETSAQDRCLEILEDIILHNIVPRHRTNPSDSGLVWDLLDIMAGVGGMELRRFLQKACQHWSRTGKLKASLVTSLQTHVNTDNDSGAWLMLSDIAPSAAKFKHDFVLEYWDEKAKVCEATEYSTCQRVLTVIGCIAKSLTREERTSVIDDLKSKLLAFEFPPELVTATVSTLSKLCDTEGGSHSQKEEWCTDLLMACDNFLSGLILNENQFDIPNEDKVIRHLFTLGEIAQLCPANTPKRVFMLVQSLIAAPCLSPDDTSTCGANTDRDSPHVESTPNTEATPEASLHKSPLNSQPNSQQSSQCSSQAPQSIAFSQGSQATRFSQGTQILSQFRGSKMSNKIRAHAFVTLGKLCLQNEDVAKKCVSALARELEISQDHAIRNNVVVILCDLCVRYTTLVDIYVVNIAACLKDSSALVRKQTLTLLTRLLQEDFLKWKGVLFFRFITSLLDDSKDISSFAEFCLIHLLLQRNPKMFFHHLVECVFHFNGYEDHSVYNKFQQTDREKKMFSLKGQANFGKRMKLYTFMLEHMADDERFKLTAKLCQDVLGGVVDNIIPLTAETKVLLQDTLSILCSKEIKLASLKTKAVDDVMDEQDMAAVVMEKAKKTLITQVVKKNVIENIVPIVISLKLILEQHRSPVLKYLMLYLRELMKDYKDEVKEILAADRQLATEIEYDLRKFEEEENRQKAPSTIVSPRGTGSRSGSPAIGKSPSGSQAGSPKVSSPGTGGSPRPCSAKSPTVTGSLPSTPAVSRSLSLSTLAILNSAKKAIEKAKQGNDVSSTRKSVSSRNHSSARAANNVQTEQRGDVDIDDNDRQPPPIAMLFKTPDNSVKRAISTPSGVLNNITFHQDQNITLVPPSPIPSSLPIRFYGNTQTSSESSPSRSPAGHRRGGNKATGDMVYMFSPDQPLPKPRSWNVSATPKGKTESRPKRGDNQENEGDTTQGEESPKTRTSGRSKRRSQRLQYS